MRKTLAVSVVLMLVATVVVSVWYAASPARGQQPREEKRMTGEVVGTTETQVTVRADETGEVVVWNAGWRKVPGTNRYERNADHLALIGALEKGDKVVVRGRFLEEMWIIEEIARADGAGEGGTDLEALRTEIAALRKQISDLQAEIAEIKALLKQLAEK
ncbi:MAG: hypothetical protein ACE5R4_09105 [Armatimonadota bacterium]